ncbi:polysaccharide pyruvyl transferase family protein [Candidatus Peregrinibacteria bacterium]|nr:polysaccharide pyruvyl transferase family protein [Candidatus Peregrinibacteria bacterium]
MKIVIVGNYGANNLGDEMILEGIISLIKISRPDAKITVFSANPKDTKARHKVESVLPFPSGFRSSLRWLFSRDKATKVALKECDLFILGGGGLFGSLTFRANIIWGVQAMMAYLYKKPVAMLGQSIGPLKGYLRQRIVKYLFSKAKIITVRDQNSAKRLKKLNIKQNIQIFPDFALTLKAPNTAKRAGSILVCLRQLTGLSSSFKTEIAKFLDNLYQEYKYKINFLAFEEPADHILHDEIIALMREKEAVSKLKTPTSSIGTLELFANAHFALSMRLHSTISAIRTATPFLALAYASKVKELLETHHLKEYYSDLEDFNTNSAIKYFTRINNNYPAVQKSLERCNENIARQNFQQAFARILQE